MPLPFLAFLAPALGLATSLAGSLTGQGTAAHYIQAITSLLSKGVQLGIDIDAELKVLFLEMQTLVAEGRAASDEEMEASNARLRAKVEAALAHDTSAHPHLRDL